MKTRNTAVGKVNCTKFCVHKQWKEMRTPEEESTGACGLLLLTRCSPLLPPAISAIAQAKKLRQRLLAQSVLCI